MTDRAATVRTMQVADLDAVRAWRNAPEVRAVMLSAHEIGPHEHRAWFDRVSADPTRHLLIVEDAGFPIGFVQFSSAGSCDVADWGFYAVPGAPAGTGRKLGGAALAHAFGPLALHKLCGQALGHNLASIRFHESLGFIREGVLRDQHLASDGRRLDMICYGLLATEWATRQIQHRDKS